MTLIFLFACATLVPMALYNNVPTLNVSITIMVALLVCLIPTTIGGLLSSIGIAGMDRLIRKNVLAMSGRAIEAAGDVDVLLLDKTGTITLGNRMAADFLPVRRCAQGTAGTDGAVGQPGRRNARRPIDRNARRGTVSSTASKRPTAMPASFPSRPRRA